MGPKQAGEFVQLYMVAGHAALRGRSGAEQFRNKSVGGKSPIRSTASRSRWTVGWTRAWRPSHIIATKFKTGANPESGVVRTRPLCPYPQVARYSGSGSTDDAANFRCVAPESK